MTDTRVRRSLARGSRRRRRNARCGSAGQSCTAAAQSCTAAAGQSASAGRSSGGSQNTDAADAAVAHGGKQNRAPDCRARRPAAARPGRRAGPATGKSERGASAAGKTKRGAERDQNAAPAAAGWFAGHCAWRRPDGRTPQRAKGAVDVVCLLFVRCLFVVCLLFCRSHKSIALTRVAQVKRAHIPRHADRKWSTVVSMMYPYDKIKSEFAIEGLFTRMKSKCWMVVYYDMVLMVSFPSAVFS